jgi:hypothetical protein
MPKQTQGQARPGDIVVVHSRFTGDPGRTGVIEEVLGPPDHPHFRVRWDEEHVSLLWPGPDATVRPGSRRRRRRGGPRASRISLLALVATAFALALAGIGAALAPAESSGDHALVRVFFPRGSSASCSRVDALPRRVVRPAVLSGAMRALVAGPSAAERARGYGGWFSRRTAGSVRSVRISRGTAYVDFRNFSRVIPSASSSCGSTLLLAQLDRTARQFPTVRRTTYSFDGSRRAFYEWLQRPAP